MSRVVRKYEINRRRAKRKKMRYLKAKLQKLTSPAQVQAVIAKIRRIDPHYPVQQLQQAKR